MNPQTNNDMNQNTTTRIALNGAALIAAAEAFLTSGVKHDKAVDSEKAGIAALDLLPKTPKGKDTKVVRDGKQALTDARVASGNEYSDAVDAFNREANRIAAELNTTHFCSPKQVRSVLENYGTEVEAHIYSEMNLWADACNKTRAERGCDDKMPVFGFDVIGFDVTESVFKYTNGERLFVFVEFSEVGYYVRHFGFIKKAKRWKEDAGEYLMYGEDVLDLAECIRTGSFSPCGLTSMSFEDYRNYAACIEVGLKIAESLRERCFGFDLNGFNYHASFSLASHIVEHRSLEVVRLDSFKDGRFGKEVPAKLAYGTPGEVFFEGYEGTEDKVRWSHKVAEVSL